MIERISWIGVGISMTGALGCLIGAAWMTPLAPMAVALMALGTLFAAGAVAAVLKDSWRDER